MRADFLENQACMTLCAFHSLMHPTQRIPSLIVIEFGIRTNWFPTCVRVAILTGNRNRAVRICDLCLWPTHLRTCFVSGPLQSHAREQRCHQKRQTQPAPATHSAVHILRGCVLMPAHSSRCFQGRQLPCPAFGSETLSVALCAELQAPLTRLKQISSFFELQRTLCADPVFTGCLCARP